MKLNQNLSWKFMLPVGIVIWVIFNGGMIAILGQLLTLFGIIDLCRVFFKKKKSE